MQKKNRYIDTNMTIIIVIFYKKKKLFFRYCYNYGHNNINLILYGIL